MNEVKIYNCIGRTVIIDKNSVVTCVKEFLLNGIGIKVNTLGRVIFCGIEDGIEIVAIDWGFDIVTDMHVGNGLSDYLVAGRYDIVA